MNILHNYENKYVRTILLKITFFWISKGKVATSDRWCGQMCKMLTVYLKFSPDLTYQKSLKSFIFDRVIQHIKRWTFFGTHSVEFSWNKFNTSRMHTVKLKLNKTFEEISDPALDLVLPVVVSLSTADFGDPTWVYALSRRLFHAIIWRHP